jgi:hypothetical protein
VLDTADGERVIVWHVPPREGNGPDAPTRISGRKPSAAVSIGQHNGVTTVATPWSLPELADPGEIDVAALAVNR